MKFSSDMVGLHTKNVVFRKILIIGFPGREQEEIRALLSRIPPQLLKWVEEIRRTQELGAKHGRYLPKRRLILVNPHTFTLTQKLGVGPGRVNPAELMIVHEVGHSVFENLPDIQRQRWLRLSGWVEGDREGNAPRYIEKRPGWPEYTSDWTHKKGIVFPRKYSEKTPDEDFADSFAYFILGKPYMLEKSKAEFIQTMMNHLVTAYPKTNDFGPSRQ